MLNVGFLMTQLNIKKTKKVTRGLSTTEEAPGAASHDQADNSLIIRSQKVYKQEHSSLRSTGKPAKPQPVPKYKKLQKVNCLDIMSHIEEVRSSITPVFGCILRMNSRKKVNLLILFF